MNQKEYPYVVIFDLETTGLPLGRTPFYQNVTAYEKARIVSISMQFWKKDKDPVTGKCEHVFTYNAYRKPEGFVWGGEEFHQITEEDAFVQGKSFIEILGDIMPYLMKSDLMVCHNVLFDKNVFLSEVFRVRDVFPGGSDVLFHLNQMRTYCTMEHGVMVTRIPLPSDHSRFKKPKLVELYRKLFGVDFQNPHSADSDCAATVAIYWQLRDLEM